MWPPGEEAAFPPLSPDHPSGLKRYRLPPGGGKFDVPMKRLLAGFDEPMETWAAEIVRNVIEEPLLVVHQDAAEMGRVAVDLALSSIDGADVTEQQRLIRPILSWEHED